MADALSECMQKLAHACGRFAMWPDNQSTKLLKQLTFTMAWVWGPCCSGLSRERDGGLVEVSGCPLCAPSALLAR